MPVDLGIGQDRDITAAAYRKAVAKARDLGMHDPKNDLVKKWAVALLEPKTHFTEEAIRAVLATDFSDLVAVLVVRSDLNSEHSGEDADSRRCIHRLCHTQELVPATAKIAIGVYLMCAAEFANDSDVHKEVEATMDRQSRAQRKRTAPAGMAPRSPPPAAKQQKAVEQAEMEAARTVKKQLFEDCYNRSHFEECSIRNGVGGALVINQLGGIGAPGNLIYLNAAESGGSSGGADRQTTSFIENSTEAGILLGGNGTLHAMMVALSRAFRMQPSVTKVW